MKFFFKLFACILSTIASVSLVSIEGALAFEEDAECLDRDHKFSDCKIILRDNLLNIEYDDDDEAELNLVVSLDRVTTAASVKYFTSGFFERSGFQSGIFIEYIDNDEQVQMKVLEIHPREGFIFLSLLRQNGIEVNWNLESN